MIISEEISLSCFDFWGPAADHAAELTNEELDRIEQIMYDSEEDGEEHVWDRTDINDLFAYDFDTVLEWLGYKQDPDTGEILRGEPGDWNIHLVDIIWDSDDPTLPSELYLTIGDLTDKDKEDVIDSIEDQLKEDFDTDADITSYTIASIYFD